MKKDFPPTTEHGFVGRDSEYNRFGTVSLLAGMDLIAVKIIPLVRELIRLLIAGFHWKYHPYLDHLLSVISKIYRNFIRSNTVRITV